MTNTHLKNARFICTLLLALCILLGCLTGCSSDTSSETPSDTPSGSRESIRPELTQLADNLYETTFTTDFNWDKSGTSELPGAACSGVQNGQYRGRNYDWIFADTDICVVHAAATENRPHASVGVSDMSFITDEDGTYDYELIPFFTVDGINDAGICIQVNVMPYGENGELTHTKAAEDDLDGGSVVRYILDNADSVESALALLKDKDIHSEMGETEELHWMLSGPASGTDSRIKTVVIEVFPDGLHVTESFVDDKPIMTNFNVANFDGSAESVGMGLGYERWQLLDKYYNQADSVMGTFDLMEKVYYSKNYDLYGELFWYSECAGVDLTKYYDEETLKELIGEETYNFYMEKYGGVYYSMALRDGEPAVNGDISETGILSAVAEREMAAYCAQNSEDGSLWITVHTSVYDLENLTLDIQVRESQDHLHFTID
ncbi:MAG: linear amide C-N hydrolase [Bacillota bacterium]|nr:linear amide C-N hydrolase [Bacillota bacterium]